MAKMVPRSGFVMSGKLGDLVFCKDGDKVYVREFVPPTDPKTPAQVAERGLFAEAVAAWRALSDPDKKDYKKRAALEGRKGYGLFLSEYLTKAHA